MFIHAPIIGTPTGKTQGIPIVEAGRLAYMNTLSDRIIQALTETQKNQSELARHVGVRSPSVNDWISGKTKTIKGQNLLRAAEFLNVNPKWLAEGTGPKSAASLKTVMEAIAETSAQGAGDGGQGHSQSAIPSEATNEEQEIIQEILTRKIPDGIRDAVLTLIKSSPKKNQD